MLPHGHRLKAGTIQAQLYHRENLLYKTGCLRSACLSCASVESSDVYLRKKKTKKHIAVESHGQKEKNGNQGQVILLVEIMNLYI